MPDPTELPDTQLTGAQPRAAAAMHADVLVIGGGPAGSMLARQLALAGIDTVLVDKQRFPRDKPCGEFLSPECQPYLTALGLGSLLQDLGAHAIAGMHIHGAGFAATGRFVATAERAESRTGYGVRRLVLDDALLRAARDAGARVHTRHEFLALERDADGAIVGARLRGDGGDPILCRARWVVGADGVHSRVAGDLGVRRPLRWLQQIALVAHFDGVTRETFAEVHLLRAGFFAATSVDDGSLGLNLVLPRKCFRERTAADWDEFVAAHAAAAPALAARLVGARRLAPWRGIGPLAFRSSRVAVPGAALVGDAAGYVDPLTGEGLFFAMFGARVLGEALQEALASPSRAKAAMRRYASRRGHELAPRMFLSKLLQRGLRHPWVVAAFLRGLTRWPRLADLLVTMSGDSIHPRDLWRPTFWREFGRSA